MTNKHNIKQIIYRRVSLFTVSLVLMVTSVTMVLLSPLDAAAVSRNIIFPVIGGATYSDDFTAPRTNGRHKATDIFASKGQQVVSATDGTITYVGYPQPSWGYAVYVRDDQGYEYAYIHLNNDTPGTDNGSGGGIYAYGPDIERGNRVVRGQLLGYVGDSGNAETTPPHLHFEMYGPDDLPINPYPSLRHAENDGRKISKASLYPQLAHEILPYGNATSIGINVALGTFSLAGEKEIVTGPRSGGGPHIRVFDQSQTRVSSFFAYDLAFRGGIDVATGDVDGDGVDEIITAPGKGGGPHIKVFERNGTLIGDFFAYDKKMRDGVNISSGDIDGDGVDEIITGPDSGSGSHVRIFNITGDRVQPGFFAYDQANRDGVDVSVGNVSGTLQDEIIVGPGKGSGPHVKVYDASGVLVRDFFAYEKTNRNGARVSVGDAQVGIGLDEIVTVPAVGGGPLLKVFNGEGQVLRSRNFLEQWWRGEYDVAVDGGVIVEAAGGNRRATVRSELWE